MIRHQTGVLVVLATLLLGTSSFSMYDGNQSTPDTEMEVAGLIIKFGPRVMVSVQKNASGGISTGLPEIDRLNAGWIE